MSYIVCNRIRVNWNFEGYVFGPMLEKQQRIEIMRLIEEATFRFDNHLKGNFYQLENLDE
jgi:hypothetical protein